MIHVLIVDNSAMVRRALIDALESAVDIQVVDTASNPFIARDKIVHRRPHVVIMGVEMPRMDGISFLKKLRKYFPLPVLIITESNLKGEKQAFEALAAGAVDIVPRPEMNQSPELLEDLAEKIRAAARVQVGYAQKANTTPQRDLSWRNPQDFKTTGFPIIAIGASTGGTQALPEVLKRLPRQCPPILMAQHMPANFTTAFANRMNQVCQVEVQEAKHGDAVRAGLALLAPGGYHMTLAGLSGRFRVELNQDPPVHHQRPAVDPLFESVVQQAGGKALGVILTGMGRDGAAGLLKMKQANAFTIAQDKATSVVFGMPQEAIRLGAAQQVLPLDEIAGAIVDAVNLRAYGR